MTKKISQYASLYLSIGLLLIIILVEYVFILLNNNGMFVYTLDDPYIHLALAENIRQGHYGINVNEFSAPSSSIVWPFLLAIFLPSSSFPLLLNILCSIGTVYFFYKIIKLSIPSSYHKTTIIFSVILILILMTNIIGLVFIGMEHSLQLLIVTFIAYGLILVKERGVITWLIVAIIAAPLVRYENIVISFAAISYLIINKYYKQAFISILLLSILMIGFSLFLLTLGLEVLPTSVLQKSYLVGINVLFNIMTPFQMMFYEFIKNARQSVAIDIVCFSAAVFVFFSKEKNHKKQLLIILIMAILMHLWEGKYGWYHRYEIYIFAFSLLIMIYCCGPSITFLFVQSRAQKSWLKIGMVLFIVLSIIYVNRAYVSDLFTIYRASNNVYEQQYQMHRFVVDYYKKPVAVNDIGWVSYKNDAYVLDLLGLASLEVLRLKYTNSAEWMDKLVREKNTKLILIYRDWFETIPPHWIKIGVLHYGEEAITMAENDVHFYTVDEVSYHEIVSELHNFQKTLPKNSIFIFE